MIMEDNLRFIKLIMDQKLFFKDGDTSRKRKKIAEWDPYTLPVIAETSGSS
jgi:hypothetical protein